MTVAIATSLTKYIPLFTNIPTFDIASKIQQWQKSFTPDVVLSIISSDVEVEGHVQDYNNYDWNEIIN